MTKTTLVSICSFLVSFALAPGASAADTVSRLVQLQGDFYIVEVGADGCTTQLQVDFFGSPTDPSQNDAHVVVSQSSECPGGGLFVDNLTSQFVVEGSLRDAHVFGTDTIDPGNVSFDVTYEAVGPEQVSTVTDGCFVGQCRFVSQSQSARAVVSGTIVVNGVSFIVDSSGPTVTTSQASLGKDLLLLVPAPAH